MVAPAPQAPVIFVLGGTVLPVVVVVTAVVVEVAAGLDGVLAGGVDVVEVVGVVGGTDTENTSPLLSTRVDGTELSGTVGAGAERAATAPRFCPARDSS